jgi:predicted RND superfamily exporter protein
MRWACRRAGGSAFGLKRFVEGIVDFSGRRPLVVLLVTAVVLAVSWGYTAKTFNVRPDFQELLPSDSPSYRAFQAQLDRLGGGATVIALAESPDRDANERWVDDFADRIEKEQNDERTTCASKCATDKACIKDCRLIAYVERGTKDVRKFFEDNRWLYADIDDLRQAERDVDRQVAIRSGLVADLDDDESSSARGSSHAEEKKPALGLDEYNDRAEAKARERPEYSDFPRGYFETKDGTIAAVRVVSSSTGLGDRAGDALLARAKAIAAELAPEKYDSRMRIGFAGDVASAVAEKESIASQARFAFIAALVMVLTGVVLFYRSVWSLVVISLPAFVGVGCAYALAMARFGYVNVAGAFLGAIILGNGINYPIVLLSRYREFRARGQAPPDARRDALWNAFRAELVGACVGSIAYGSLTITQFRGFSQFGLIGFFGMLLVWVSMIPIVPALLVVIEGIQARLPPWMRDPEPRLLPDGSRGPVTRYLAHATEKAPWLFLIAAAVVSLVAVYGLFVHKDRPNGPGAQPHTFVADPWEYNFGRLGSKSSTQTGPAYWSNKADRVFQKINIGGAKMLANTPEEVPLVKRRILENDAADPYGKLISDVVTVEALLPGSADEQRAKLAVLDDIRSHLTPRVLYDLPEDERKRVDRLYPPESLHVLEAKDLPDLLRRRFEEKDGRIGTVFYVKPWDFARKADVVHSDGWTMLRLATTTAHVTIPDPSRSGQMTTVDTASRWSILAEMIKSMERDGPLATLASFLAVMIVVLVATHTVRGAAAVLTVLVMSVLWMMGGAALMGVRLNFLNFIALPITFGIGCEYPFNVYDRSRLLGGEVSAAVKRVGGAVALCSYTTVVGYASLLFSDQQALQSFGHLAVSGEVACVVGALLVLPALLHVMERRKGTTRRVAGQDSGHPMSP